MLDPIPVLTKYATRRAIFWGTFVVLLVLASIETFNTYLLFRNYTNPPPLIPYPTFIGYLSFSLAIPLIYATRKLTIKSSINVATLIHFIMGFLFVMAHIFISNLSDWYFFDREWSIVGSFQFVLTIRFLYELLIYAGLSGIIVALQVIRNKYTEISTKQYLSAIEVKKAGKIIYIKTEEIAWFEADDNYIKIYSKDTSFLIRKTIKEIKNELDPSKFQQIHRSYIVNLKQVKELEPLPDGGCTVHLRNGKALKATKTYRSALQSKLS